MTRNGWDEVFTLSSHRNNANVPLQGQYLLGYLVRISDPWLTAGTRAMMTRMMRNKLEEGFILDRQWFWLRGEMERTKRPALLALGRIFADAEVPYAIIGGIALQVHQAEPRTTLDIDVAVVAYGKLPRTELEVAGFRCTGQFSHSENWVGPEGTPVQFTDDPALAEAIARAEDVELEDVRLRVVSRVDLLHEKLRAASDPARRRSKRLQDLADAQALLESIPTLEQELSSAERALLDRLPR